MSSSDNLVLRSLIYFVSSRALAVSSTYGSGFQTGVRGPKGVRDGFPGGPREDSEK